MQKKFLTYTDQLNKLESEKGLLIPDRTYAEETLKRISYFALINGYKEPFKNLTTGNYKDHTSFEDIVALYTFDEGLRELFLKYLLKLERHIRSLLSYYFTEKYGESQTCYLNPANFTDNRKFAADVARLINTLDNLANRSSDYPYINHQRNTYRNVPLWVLVNGITFGSLSKFYALTTQDLKAKISKNFASVNEKQLGQYLTVLTKFRNVCAHNERLYNYKTKDDIPDTVLHGKLMIPKRGAQYVYGKHDLFSVVIAFRYLLPNDEFKKFKSSLNHIIQHYLSSSAVLSESCLLNMMGFPGNWRKMTAFQKERKIPVKR